MSVRLTSPPPMLDPSLHRQLAASFFNHVWSLLDKPQRTLEEDLEMIHAAHGSRYHWGFAGTAQQWSVGEWQIARVYAMLKRPEAAAYHAAYSLQWAREDGVGPFYRAYAFEALARAHALAGDAVKFDRCLAEARLLLEAVTEPEERKALSDDLMSLVRP